MGTIIVDVSAEVTIKISNPTSLERKYETVEISWRRLQSEIKGLTPENVAVHSAEGGEMPSQVIYNGDKTPRALIFQVSLAVRGKTSFVIDRDRRCKSYPLQAYGRYVPERLDDYAWENNYTAYRLYGPRLKSPVSPGIDVWVKSTERLVIDERYKRGNYHHNYGDGMDCYKVGRTLGAGACAPIADNKLWLSRNYATQERLDNGPIRTTVRLSYDEFDVNGEKVKMEKFIELDANTYFCKMINIYHSKSDKLCVGAGVVLHKVKKMSKNKRYIAITEEASDTKNPAEAGDISLAVIVPNGVENTSISELVSYGKKRFSKAEHLLVKVLLTERNNKTFVYWSGSSWSGAGMTAEKWEKEVKEKLYTIKHPLKVKEMTKK